MAPHLPNFGPAEPETRSRSMLALTVMCLLLVAVPTMVGLIGYRSITIHTPSTALIVTGDSSLDGAKIEVTELAGSNQQWVSWITRADEWQCPILLDPAKYHITVTHRGTEILSEDFETHRLYGHPIDLPSMVLIIGNRALADARFEITYSGANPHIPRLMDVKLTAEDHFRQSVYLMPGEYRATARTALPHDDVLAQTDFVVDRTNPVRVDLGKVFEEGAD